MRGKFEKVLEGVLGGEMMRVIEVEGSKLGGEV